jgi:uncharacterized protein YigE (DUF2233 family)
MNLPIPYQMKKTAYGIFLLLILLLIYNLSELFNFKSNITYLIFRNSDEPLYVRFEGKKIPLQDIKSEVLQQAQKSIHSSEGVEVKQITIERKPENILQTVCNVLNPSILYVVEFSPNLFRFFTAYEPDFAPSTAAKIAQKQQLNFCINANFYSLDYKPIGWIVSQGEELNPERNDWTGYFFVKNNQPYFGSVALLQEVKGKVTEAAQCYPSIIKNYQIFDYLKLKDNRFFSAGKLSYRSLAGMKKNGNIIFVVSGNGAILNIKEMTLFARCLDIKHATLFDGGRALQYYLSVPNFELSFHAFSGSFGLSKLSRTLRPARSPIFIGATKKQK